MLRRCKCGTICSTKAATRCQPCKRDYAKKWGRTPQGQEARRNRYLRDCTKDRPHLTPFYCWALKAVQELLREVRAERKIVERKYREALKQGKGIARWRAAFSQRIFQTTHCSDCGQHFETLYLEDKLRFGAVRCGLCAYQRRLKNHGGGPRRRCKKFGVPYEVISPTAIFIRDNHECKLCGTPLEMMVGVNHPYASELDHIIPLSMPGSPGHVLSNVQSAHRSCNIAKGDQACTTQ